MPESTSVNKNHKKGRPMSDCRLKAQLRRFLYVGKVKPEYQPGNWFVHKYYLKQNVTCIDQLAEDPSNISMIITTIIVAKTRKLVQNPETIVFALAVCAQQEKHERLRREAYDAVKIVCDTPELFFLFNKFCSQLSKAKENPTNGWGHGWRRAVKGWYDKKRAMDLAKIVTRYKGRHGWKHKDIMKLAHVDGLADPRECVYEYVLFGLKKVKQTREKESETRKRPEIVRKVIDDIIKYFEDIEDFKHCEDEVRAAALLETHGLTLDHVPGHMLKSEEIWNALLSSMSLTDILKNLQRIHNLGFLKPNGVILGKVIDAMSEHNVTIENIHPAVFLVTLKNYENSGKPLSFEKRKVKEQAKRPLPPPPKVNTKVVDALNKMLDFSFTTLKPTDVGYMITINMNKTMLDNGCWQCGNVNAAEAGCLIALSLLRAEKNVTVAIFKDNAIQCVDVDMNSTLNQMMEKLEPTNVEIIDLSQPMQWAAQENKKFDVFINVTDQICPKTNFPEKGIISYREIMRLPNSKLVNCAMCASSTYDKEDYEENILTICGFDEKVPKIIEAFAKSLF